MSFGMDNQPAAARLSQTLCGRSTFVLLCFYFALPFVRIGNQITSIPWITYESFDFKPFVTKLGVGHSCNTFHNVRPPKIAA